MSRVLDPAEAKLQLCDELTSVVEAIRERFGVSLGPADFDMRAHMVEFTPERELTRAEAEALPQFCPATSTSTLEFTQHYVSCTAHWQTLVLRRA